MHDWRKILADNFGIKVHPKADDWDMLKPDELRRLGHDIITKGLSVPVVVYTPGMITGDDGQEQWLIDGRNRIAALALVLGAEDFDEHVDAIINGTFNARKELADLYMSGRRAHKNARSGH